MSDEVFVLCAGTTELIIGLCLMFGFFPRTIILAAWVFINMTLTIFDWVELVGHLPLYGAMAVLLIWTPTEEDQRLWVRGVLGTGEGSELTAIRTTDGRANRHDDEIAEPEPANRFSATP
jgi:hypothetical protein